MTNKSEKKYHFIKTGLDFIKELPIELKKKAEIYNNSASDFHFIYTYNRFSTIQKELYNNIKLSEKSVKITAYELDHKDFLDLLTRVADKLKGRIYFITNLEKEFDEYFAESEEEGEENSKEKRKRFIEEIRSNLARSGVFQKGLKSHAKFVIIDDKILLLMSANITKRALGDINDEEAAQGKIGNFEVGLRVHDKKILTQARLYFAYLWFKANLKILPNKSDEVSVIKSESNSGILKKIIEKLNDLTDKSYESFFSKGEKNTSNDAIFVYSKLREDFLYKALKKLINLARHEIVISTYNIVKPTMDFIEALRRAIKKRRVAIKFLVKTMNWDDRQRRAIIDLLQKLPKEDDKLIIRGIPNNHSKYVIVDRKYVLISSMNIDGRYFRNGYECGILLKNKELANLLSDITDFLMDNATHEVDKNLVKRKSNY